MLNLKYIVENFDKDISKKREIYNIDFKEESVNIARKLLFELHKNSLEIRNTYINNPHSIGFESNGYPKLYWNPSDKIHIDLIFTDKNILIMDDVDDIHEYENNITGLYAALLNIVEILKKYDGDL